MTGEPTLVTEARRLVHEAAGRSLPIRLLGGVAIWVRASGEARAALGREYPDLDFVAHKRQSRSLRDLLEEQGYVPERVFNATHGAKRLLYHAPDGAHHVDVFLDVFEMSHTLDLSSRLEVEEETLPAAELLLTKLQVAEINRKDVSDAVMLLWDHELSEADGPGLLNVARAADLCGADWGLYTTITDNLNRARELAPELVSGADDRQRIGGRIDELRRRLEEAPKSMSWRMRARVGRRVRWYEVPEEVVR